MANILVCDDERSICEMLDITLRREGYKVETVNSGEAGKKKLDSALFDVVITDIKMPNIDGIEVLRHAHSLTRGLTGCSRFVWVGCAQRSLRLRGHQLRD